VASAGVIREHMRELARQTMVPGENSGGDGGR
jgi:hypothetical protein